MVRLVSALLAACSAQYYEPESRTISRFARRFFPGGPQAITFKEAFNSTHNPYAFSGPVTTLADGSKEQSFLSSPLVLDAGEIVNNYVPINWPEGKVRIKSYSGDIHKLAPGASLEALDEDGFPETVPATREDVYLHHWTVNKWQMGKEKYDSFAKEGRDFLKPGADVGQTHGANDPCGEFVLHFLFGAGNEVRGPPPSGAAAQYYFPDPYGIESDSAEMHEKGIVPLFNVHLIDIRGTPDIRGCVECNCNVTGVKPEMPHYTGGIECCHSTLHTGSRCPTKLDKEPLSYFVKYTLSWREEADPAYANQAFKPLNSMVLDESDDGQQWFDPVALPGSSRQSHEALYNDPLAVASLQGMHSGLYNIHGDGHVDKIHWGLNWTKPHLRPKKVDFSNHGCHAEYYVPACVPGRDSCVHHFRNSWVMPFDIELVAVHNHYHAAAINMTTSLEGEAFCVGLPTYDAQGFLIETSGCALDASPLLVKRGQSVQVETFYDQDERPHFGVMGYAMLYGHRLDQDTAVLV